MNQTYQVNRISAEPSIQLQELLTAQAARKYLLDHIVAVGDELVVITKFDLTHVPALPEGQQTQEKAKVVYHR